MAMRCLDTLKLITQGQLPDRSWTNFVGSNINIENQEFLYLPIKRRQNSHNEINQRSLPKATPFSHCQNFHNRDQYLSSCNEIHCLRRESFYLHNSDALHQSPDSPFLHLLTPNSNALQKNNLKNHLIDAQEASITKSLDQNRQYRTFDDNVKQKINPSYFDLTKDANICTTQKSELQDNFFEYSSSGKNPSILSNHIKNDIAMLNKAIHKNTNHNIKHSNISTSQKDIEQVVFQEDMYNAPRNNVTSDMKKLSELCDLLFPPNQKSDLSTLLNTFSNCKGASQNISGSQTRDMLQILDNSYNVNNYETPFSTRKNFQTSNETNLWNQYPQLSSEYGQPIYDTSIHNNSKIGINQSNQSYKYKPQSDIMTQNMNLTQNQTILKLTYNNEILSPKVDKAHSDYNESYNFQNSPFKNNVGLNKKYLSPDQFIRQYQTTSKHVSCSYRESDVAINTPLLKKKIFTMETSDDGSTTTINASDLINYNKTTGIVNKSPEISYYNINNQDLTNKYYNHEITSTLSSNIEYCCNLITDNKTKLKEQILITSPYTNNHLLHNSQNKSYLDNQSKYDSMNRRQSLIKNIYIDSQNLNNYRIKNDNSMINTELITGFSDTNNCSYKPNITHTSNKVFKKKPRFDIAGLIEQLVFRLSIIGTFDSLASQALNSKDIKDSVLSCILVQDYRQYQESILDYYKNDDNRELEPNSSESDDEIYIYDDASKPKFHEICFVNQTLKARLYKDRTNNQEFPENDNNNNVLKHQDQKNQYVSNTGPYIQGNNFSTIKSIKTPNNCNKYPSNLSDYKITPETQCTPNFIDQYRDPSKHSNTFYTPHNKTKSNHYNNYRSNINWNYFFRDKARLLSNQNCKNYNQYFNTNENNYPCSRIVENIQEPINRDPINQQHNYKQHTYSENNLYSNKSIGIKNIHNDLILHQKNTPLKANLNLLESQNNSCKFIKPDILLDNMCSSSNSNYRNNFLNYSQENNSVQSIYSKTELYTWKENINSSNTLTNHDSQNIYTLCPKQNDILTNQPSIPLKTKNLDISQLSCNKRISNLQYTNKSQNLDNTDSTYYPVGAPSCMPQQINFSTNFATLDYSVEKPEYQSNNFVNMFQYNIPNMTYSKNTQTNSDLNSYSSNISQNRPIPPWDLELSPEISEKKIYTNFANDMYNINSPLLPSMLNGYVSSNINNKIIPENFNENYYQQEIPLNSITIPIYSPYSISNPSISINNSSLQDNIQKTTQHNYEAPIKQYNDISEDQFFTPKYPLKNKSDCFSTLMDTYKTTISQLSNEPMKSFSPRSCRIENHNSLKSNLSILSPQYCPLTLAGSPTKNSISYRTSLQHNISNQQFPLFNCSSIITDDLIDYQNISNYHTEYNERSDISFNFGNNKILNKYAGNKEKNNIKKSYDSQIHTSKNNMKTGLYQQFTFADSSIDIIYSSDIDSNSDWSSNNSNFFKFEYISPKIKSSNNLNSIKYSGSNYFKLVKKTNKNILKQNQSINKNRSYHLSRNDQDYYVNKNRSLEIVQNSHSCEYRRSSTINKKNKKYNQRNFENKMSKSTIKFDDNIYYDFYRNLSNHDKSPHSRYIYPQTITKNICNLENDNSNIKLSQNDTKLTKDEITTAIFSEISKVYHKMNNKNHSTNVLDKMTELMTDNYHLEKSNFHNQYKNNNFIFAEENNSDTSIVEDIKFNLNNIIPYHIISQDETDEKDIANLISATREYSFILNSKETKISIKKEPQLTFAEDYFQNNYKKHNYNETPQNNQYRYNRFKNNTDGRVNYNQNISNSRYNDKYDPRNVTYNQSNQNLNQEFHKYFKNHQSIENKSYIDQNHYYRQLHTPQNTNTISPYSNEPNNQRYMGYRHDRNSFKTHSQSENTNMYLKSSLTQPFEKSNSIHEYKPSSIIDNTKESINLVKNENTKTSQKKEKKTNYIDARQQKTSLRNATFSKHVLEAYITMSAKLSVLKRIVDAWLFSEKKMLIFSQTVSMLNLIELTLRLGDPYMRPAIDLRGNKGWMSENSTFLRLDGNTSLPMRTKIIQQFDSDPTIKALILTTRVGGVGLNLQAACRVLLIDLDFNPTVDVQARERAWRIGQSNAVVIYRLVTLWTIEESIYRRQVYKHHLAARLLTGTEEINKKRSWSASLDIVGRLDLFVVPRQPTEPLSALHQLIRYHLCHMWTGGNSSGLLDSLHASQFMSETGKLYSLQEIQERKNISTVENIDQKWQRCIDALKKVGIEFNISNGALNCSKITKVPKGINAPKSDAIEETHDSIELKVLMHDNIDLEMYKNPRRLMNDNIIDSDDEYDAPIIQDKTYDDAKKEKSQQNIIDALIAGSDVVATLEQGKVEAVDRSETIYNNSHYTSKSNCKSQIHNQLLKDSKLALFKAQQVVQNCSAAERVYGKCNTTKQLRKRGKDFSHFSTMDRMEFINSYRQTSGKQEPAKPFSVIKTDNFRNTEPIKTKTHPTNFFDDPEAFFDTLQVLGDTAREPIFQSNVLVESRLTDNQIIPPLIKTKPNWNDLNRQLRALEHKEQLMEAREAGQRLKTAKRKPWSAPQRSYSPITNKTTTVPNSIYKPNAKYSVFSMRDFSTRAQQRRR